MKTSIDSMRSRCESRNPVLPTSSDVSIIEMGSDSRLVSQKETTRATK